MHEANAIADKGEFAGGHDCSGWPDRPIHTPKIICFPFAGGIMGGSHISALRLIQALDRNEFHPLIVLHSAEGQFGAFLQAHDIAFELAPSPHYVQPLRKGRTFRTLGKTPSILRQLSNYLRDRNVSLVHSNEGPMHATWGLSARMAGIPLLWHHRSSPQAMGLRYLAPWLADRVISVSDFAAPRGAMLTATQKCTIIHSPFDTQSDPPDRSASRAMAIAELGLHPEVPILGFFGNLVERKRPLLFVESIAALHRRCPEKGIMGLMFGSPLQPELETAVIERAKHLGIEDHIRMMGFRYPSEPWLAACDMLVVTAVDEPFGRTLIEAMLLQTPVVAVNSGGNPEAIRHGETGLLVPPDDAETIADTLHDLLLNRERAQQMSRTAQAEAISRFGIDCHVQSVTRIYRQMLAGRS